MTSEKICIDFLLSIYSCVQYPGGTGGVHYVKFTLFLFSKVARKVSGRVTFEQKPVLSAGAEHKDNWAFWKSSQQVQRPWGEDVPDLFAEPQGNQEAGVQWIEGGAQEKQSSYWF